MECRNCRKSYSLKEEGRRGRRLPLVLWCGHTLCSHCILSIGKKTSYVSCPECGGATPLPPGPPESQLPTDYLAVGMLTCHLLNLQCVPSYSPLHPSFLRAKETDIPTLANKEEEDKENTPLCAECCKPANVQCVQCQVSYCAICFTTVHAVSISLRRHQSIPSSASSSSSSSYCSLHPTNPIRYWCSSDQLALCSDCVIEGHRDHSFITITEAAETHRQRVGELRGEAEAATVGMERRKKSLSSAVRELRREGVGECGRMQGSVRNLHMTLWKRELELHRNLNSTLEKQIAPLQEEEKAINVKMAQLSAANAKAKTVLTSDVRLLAESEKICASLTEVKELSPKEAPPPPHISFSVGTEAKSVIARYGEFSLQVPPSNASTDAAAVEAKPPPSPSPRPSSPTSHPSPSSSPSSRLSPSPSTRPSLTPSPINLTTLIAHSSLSPLSVSFEPKKLSRNDSFRTGTYNSRSKSRSKSGSRTCSPIATATKLEETVEVWVSNVESPGEFHVHLKEEQDALQRMSRSLNDLCSAAPRGVRDICVGMKVAAIFPEDDLWYRAEVLFAFLDPPPAYVSIQYMDYGNVVNVGVNQITTLPKSLSSGPFFAHKCCLFGLRPAGRFRNVAPPEWSQKAITQFKIMTTLDKGAPIRMKEYGCNQFGCMMVDLLDPSILGPLVSVSEKLLQMGLAVREKRRDVEAATPRKIPPPLLPHVGDVVDVIMPTAVSPAEFYVQLYTSERNLESLGKFIREQENYLQPVYNPLIGMHCFAKYADDGQTYRAQVNDISSDGMTLFVHFLDYGNKEKVNKIWQLPPDLLELPVQAIQCCLNDVIPMDRSSVWPDEVSEQFSEMCGGVLQLEVCGTGVPLSVLLTEKETSQSVSAMMATQHMAMYACRTPPLHTLPSSTHSLTPSTTHTPTRSTCTPTPSTHTLTPSSHTPTPSTHTPTPSIHTLTPSTHTPTPSSHTPTPSTRTPTPSTHTPTPSTHTLTPSTHTPTPSSHTPTPSTCTPTPSTHTPTPSTHTLTPSTVEKNKTKKNKKKKSPSNNHHPHTIPPHSHTIPPHSPPLFVSSLPPPPISLPPPLLRTKPPSPTEKPTLLGSIPSLPLPSVGALLECKVVQVIDPGHFFVQPLNGNSPKKLRSQLAKLPPDQQSNENWSTGDVCLSAYQGEKWFRARIVQRLSPCRVRLLFVDYGNEAEVDVDELAVMPQKLCKIPAQALKACLAGVMPPGEGGAWTNEMAVFFSSLVLEKTFTVTVEALPTYPSQPLAVSLRTNFPGQLPADISSLLLAACAATHSPTHLPYIPLTAAVYTELLSPASHPSASLPSSSTAENTDGNRE